MGLSLCFVLGETAVRAESGAAGSLRPHFPVFS
jgi:hypothetical protein